MPASVIPANIAKYVESKFPKNKITSIDRDKKSIDIELDNDVELKFNKKGEMVELES